MRGAGDFNVIRTRSNNIDNIIEEYIYPEFDLGYITSKLYLNILIQESVTVKEMTSRLKELGFRVSVKTEGLDAMLFVEIPKQLSN